MFNDWTSSRGVGILQERGRILGPRTYRGGDGSYEIPRSQENARPLRNQDPPGILGIALREDLRRS